MPAPKLPKSDPFEESFDRLERMLPAAGGRALRWLHGPGSGLVRLPLGILCIIAGVFWFLPVVGLEFLPIGLLLVAQDVPFLRRPVGRAMLRLLDGVSWVTGRLKTCYRRIRRRRRR